MNSGATEAAVDKAERRTRPPPSLAGFQPHRDKPPAPRREAVAPDGGGVREGGDTIVDAVPIPALPFLAEGYTCGFGDEYEAVFFHSAQAPDVVYSFTPATQMFIDIDMCGSDYDTMVLVLDEEANTVACSDDTYGDAGNPCGQWHAKLEFLELVADVTYYIVIDGFNSQRGDYMLSIDVSVPCHLDCPARVILEGEPALVEGYTDIYIGGCFSDWSESLSYILPIENENGGQENVCGVNGWCIDGACDQHWDHDWFEVVIGQAGYVTVTIEAQRSTWLPEFKIPAGLCNQKAFYQEAPMRPCGPAEPTLTGAPGSI